MAKKTITLVEGIHVTLLNTDSQSPMETNAYVGQEFNLDGRRVKIVSNTGLTWTVRYLTLFERIKYAWDVRIRSNG